MIWPIWPCASLFPSSSQTQEDKPLPWPLEAMQGLPDGWRVGGLRCCQRATGPVPNPGWCAATRNRAWQRPKSQWVPWRPANRKPSVPPSRRQHRSACLGSPKLSPRFRARPRGGVGDRLDRAATTGPSAKGSKVGAITKEKLQDELQAIV